MKQFLKITKTKINILFAFLALSFVFGKITSVLYVAIINKISFENMEHYTGSIFQIPFLVLLFIEFYLFACLAIYLVKKDKKITLSFSELKQFLKITKTKIIITISLVVLSFVWQLIFAILYGKIVNRIGFENIEYYMDNVFPVPFYILFILKFYFFTCVAVYLVKKSRNLNKA